VRYRYQEAIEADSDHGMVEAVLRFRCGRVGDATGPVLLLWGTDDRLSVSPAECPPAVRSRS